MVAASRSVWALCLGMLRTLQLAAATDCPAVPEGGDADAAMYRSMTCVHPDTISGAPATSSSIQLIGLNNMTSKGVVCQKTDNEAKIYVLEGAGSMRLGAATCELMALGFSRTSDTEAQLRLDYDRCTSGPTHASVVMNVAQVKDFMAPTTSFPFLQDACTAKTTTLAPAKTHQEYTFSETMVGASTCEGEVIKAVKDMDKRSCKLLCIASVESIAAGGGIVDGNPEACLGYAINEDMKGTGNENCHIYGKNKAVVNLTKSGETGWECYNLTTNKAVAVESTPAPPTAAELAAADAALPRLNIDLEKEAATASILYFAPKDSCYKGFNMITLQDSSYTTISAKVKESEWQEFLSMVPLAPLTESEMSSDESVETSRRLEASFVAAKVADVYVDRVTYTGSLVPTAPAVPGELAVPGAAQAPEVMATPAPVTTTSLLCTPVPDAVSPEPMILAIILGIAVFPCGYIGYRAGHRQPPYSKIPASDDHS